MLNIVTDIIEAAFIALFVIALGFVFALYLFAALLWLAIRVAFTTGAMFLAAIVITVNDFIRAKAQPEDGEAQ